MITLDIIGTIYTPGEFDEEGNVITEPTPLPGYHVNVSRLTPEIEPYAIQPEHPTRLFAGAPTFFLRFDDEAAFKAVFYDTDEETEESTLKPFVTAEPPRVPYAVSRAQGKAVLVQAGLWDAVVDFVASVSDPVAEIALNDTQYWTRHSAFLSAAAAALGLSSEQLDSLFIQADAIHF